MIRNTVGLWQGLLLLVLGVAPLWCNAQTYQIPEQQYQDFQRYLEVKDIDAKLVSLFKLYTLAPNAAYADITDRVLTHPLIAEDPQYQAKLQRSKRRFMLFRYPSDQLQLLGFISFIPEQPTLPTTIVYCRGGNNSFGLPNLGHRSLTQGNYTYVGSLLRGGINPGRDEYGGKDVNDVINLVRYLPTLATQLAHQPIATTDLTLLGVGRGAMQMFLALARSPWLQSHVTGAISAIGLVDMNSIFSYRPDMVTMFKLAFQLNGLNKKIWISERDPLQQVEHINPELPILLLQANHDIRIDKDCTRTMQQKLLQRGQPVTLWQKGTGHTFDGIDAKLADWIAQTRKH